MYTDEAAEQLACADFIEVREVVSGELEGETRLTAGRFCKHRCTCPHCAARRAGKYIFGYVPKLLELRAGFKGAGFYFATGTVRNGDDLKATFSALNDTARRFTQNIKKQRQRRRGDLANVVGGLIAFETKRSDRQGGWHPHVHMILAAEGRLDYSAARAAWVQASAGASQHFRTRQLHSEYLASRGELDAEQYKERLRTDLCEVVKYPLKFERGREGEVWFVGEQLRGRRLLRPFGELHGVEVSDDLLDEPLDWELHDFITRWFYYQAGQYRETSVRRGVASGEIVETKVPF